MNGSLSLLSLALLASLAVDPPPSVSTTSPYGGQRGTEVEVTFYGARLDGAYDILLPREGIELTAIEAIKNNQCKATLRIAPDCPLGPHPMRLCTDHGIAGLRLFHIGALPEVQEEKDAQLQTIPFGVTVNGRIADEETDRFAVALTQGQRLCCEVQGMRLGSSAKDLAISVFGPDGSLLARADDTALGHKDPWLSLRATATGPHEVHVRPAFPDNGNRGSYRLHVGSFPRPTAARPSGGLPGEKLAVTFIEQGLGERPPMTAEVTLPDDGSDWFSWYPEDDRGAAPTPVTLRIGGPPNLAPQPDEKGRRWLEPNGSVDGVVSKPESADRFWFKAKKGKRIEFRAIARALRSPLDPVLIARRANGGYLASDDDSAGAGDSRLRFTPPEDGNYSIEVRDLLRGGSPAHVFRLEVGTSASAMRTGLVVQRRQDPVCNVPSGGNYCGVLRLDNADTKDGLAFALDNLPPGVIATFGTVRSNRVPFVLTAAPATPPDACLTELRLTAQKEPLQRDPDYHQVLPLVTVRNDQPILSTVARRLPVAVTRPAPFRVKLLPVTVPLLRDGKIGVKVQIERDEGFKQAVRVHSPRTPSGIGSSRLTIAGDKSQGVLALEANSSAVLDLFPLAVIASSGSGNSSSIQASTFQRIAVRPHLLKVKWHRARTTAGQPTELRIELQPQTELTQPYTAQLHGLPKYTESQKLEVAPGTKELVFPLKVGAKTRPGRHRSVRIEFLLPHENGKVLHRFSGGELRVDKLPEIDNSETEEKS